MRRAVALKRRVPGQMNKTEARFFDQLKALRSHRLIDDFAFEPITIRLADRTTYTPDFMVIHNDGTIEFVEVKGSWKAPHQEDSRVKIKVAAEQHWYAKFSAVVPSKDKRIGWEHEAFGPNRKIRTGLTATLPVIGEAR